MKIVGIFAIICWDLLSNSDDEGRVGIKRLITRNQFVDNTTRGFESLPLRQKHGKSIWVSRAFLFVARGIEFEASRRKAMGSHSAVGGIWRFRGSKPNKLKVYELSQTTRTIAISLPLRQKNRAPNCNRHRDIIYFLTFYIYFPT